MRTKRLLSSLWFLITGGLHSFKFIEIAQAFANYLLPYKINPSDRPVSVLFIAGTGYILVAYTTCGTAIGKRGATKTCIALLAAGMTVTLISYILGSLGIHNLFEFQANDAIWILPYVVINYLICRFLFREEKNTTEGKS